MLQVLKTVCLQPMLHNKRSHHSERPFKLFKLVNSAEKAMATHSSTLAWKIPWMEEPVRLQSMGLQRVRDITLPTKVHLVRLWFFQ